MSTPTAPCAPTAQVSWRELANLTGNPDQDMVIDGLTGEIVTSLSKLSDRFVIARDATFAYKDKAAKVAQLVEELGVQYVLEGRIEMLGNKARITARLFGAAQGQHLWGENYDLDLEFTPWIGQLSGDGLDHLAGVVMLELDGAPVSKCRGSRA